MAIIPPVPKELVPSISICSSKFCGFSTWLNRAIRIIDFAVNVQARANDWRLPEIFNFMFYFSRYRDIYSTTESELKLVKSGGVWKVDESSAKSFSHSMYGNVNLLGGGETIR